MKFRLLLFIFLYSVFSFAQEQKALVGRNDANGPKIGKIKGVVFDKATNIPVEFATVALLMYKDSSLVSGAIVNAKGEFNLEEIPFGRFFFKINFIGYNQTVIDTIAIRPRRPEINLGKITLAQNSELLKTVEVAADRGDMQIGIDRKIFNVEKSIVSQGGSANDVLQQIPSVNVDIDGNISLRGSGNVTVLVDGKLSGITGSSRQAILQQIPASSIESIEVITNPSAKYDPDGMSGIINIVMKKNKLSGFNGGLSIGVGTRDKYNGAVNISYRNKKVNVYANYGYRLNNRFGEGNTLRKNILPDTSFYLNEVSNLIRRNTSHNIKAGLEFYLNEKNTLGFSVLYNTSKELNPQSSRYKEFDENNIFAGGYARNVTENTSSNNTDYTLDYKKTFKIPKQELVFSATYSDAIGKKTARYNQYDYTLKFLPLANTPLLQDVKTKDKNNVTVALADGKIQNKA